MFVNLYADSKLDHVHAHIQHMFLCPMKPFEDMIEHLCKHSFRGLCLVNQSVIEMNNKHATNPKNLFPRVTLTYHDRLGVNLRKRRYKVKFM